MKTSSSAFYCGDLLLLNARRIQAFLQQQDFLIAFDASELLVCFQGSCSGPAQRLISFAPTLYVSRHPLHRRQARFDRVGGGQFPPQHRSYTQAMHRQRFFQSFLQAPGGARIDPFQLPEDFLQRFFGLRVVVHRVGIAHPPIVVFLAVLGQVLLHIPPLVNLATLHLHLFTENTFHTGSPRFRSRTLPERSPPLADSSAWTVRPPCAPAPLVAVFRLAATDRSSPVPLLGPRGFAPAVVPAEFSVQQKPHNPAAFPSAHSPRWDWADAEVLPGALLRFPGWRAESAARLARSAALPPLASRPTPRLSATAHAPACNDHRPPSVPALSKCGLRVS